MKSVAPLEPLRVALIAPKNTAAEQQWLLDLVGAGGEIYRRGRAYDVVWFFNLTPEASVIRRNTNTKIVAYGPEPPHLWPYNYDPGLVGLCDLYLGHRDVVGGAASGRFKRFLFAAAGAAEIEGRWQRRTWEEERPYDFCLFARHDPNIRRAIGRALTGTRAFLAGPLFENPQAEKATVQEQCKYEFITENEITDYYFSEKLGQALAAGCVPIYYGCECVQDIVPPELFIDLRDFEGATAGENLERVIEHCLNPEVYRRYFHHLRIAAKPFLLRSQTFEGCWATPIQDYLSVLAQQGFQATQHSLRWAAWGVRDQITRAVAS